MTDTTLPPLPPLPAPDKPKRKWRTAAWIAVGVIVALIALIIGIGNANRPVDRTPAVAKPASTAPAKSEPTKAPPKPVETPKPVAAPGSLTVPYPLGYVVNIYQGDKDNTLADVAVAIKDGNAGAAIAQANQFNEAAQPGYHYVAVEYTFTGTSATEPANVSLLLTDWSLAQTDGTLIAESNTYPVLPDGWSQTYEVNDLYEGQTGAAVVLYQVPDAYAGPLLATAYGKYIAL